MMQTVARTLTSIPVTLATVCKAGKCFCCEQVLLAGTNDRYSCKRRIIIPESYCFQTLEICARFVEIVLRTRKLSV